MAAPRFPRNRSRISTAGMTRRDVVKSMLFTGGALVFAGFGRPDRAVAQGKTRLTQWYHQYGEAGTEDAVKRYASEYTTENPDIEIEINWQLGDYEQALGAALLTDKGPDVFEQSTISIDQVEQGQLAPLDDLYTDELRKDFNETSLKSATVDGKIYWVKMVDDTGAIYYRKSLLEDKGVDPPKTLDEVIAAAKELTSGRQKGLFLGNDGGLAALAGPIIWSAGGNFLNDDLTAPDFDSDRTRAAMEKFRELMQSDALLTGAPTDWWDPSAFTQGLCAMQWGGLWAMPQITKEVGDDFDVLPWPPSDNESKPSTFWGGWGECVNGKSQNLDAAKAFVKWLWIDNTKDQEDWNLSYGFHVPPRTSAAEAAKALQEGPAKEVAGFLHDYGVPTPPMWTAPMATAYNDALTHVVRDGADPTTELAKAVEAVNKELERINGGG